MYGGGGSYCASVNDQIRPCRDNVAGSKSTLSQSGLRQENDAFGKNTVEQLVQRLPNRAGSASMVNQPSIAGTRRSDTPSDYTPAMAPIVPPGSVVYGLQLPVQAQSTYFVEPWERDAGPAEIAEVARAADRSGFFYVGVCDHVAIPAELSPRMGATWYDTIATLAWVAAQTTTTRLLSTVYNLTYRPALVAAKSFATLDLLSAGRAIIGVGVGHVEKEFAALGADYANRGRVSDDALRLLDVALRDGQVDGMDIEPRAVQQPRPPLWVGGSAPPAVRRAARLADGWLPQGTPLADLPPLIELYRRERGDDTGDIGAITEWLYVGSPTWDLGRPATTGTPEQIAAALHAWTDTGVNHLQVRFASRSAGELVDQVSAFGEHVGPLLSA